MATSSDFWADDPQSDGGNAADVVRGVDSAALHDAVLAVVRRGWMLSFAGSRDGYSVALTVFADGKQVRRKYYTGAEELEAALRSILTAAERPADPKPPKGKPKA